MANSHHYSPTPRSIIVNYDLDEKNLHICIGNRTGPSKIKELISRVFSEVAEIARVAQRRGQFQQLLKTQVILILNFTRIHCDYLLIT